MRNRQFGFVRVASSVLDRLAAGSSVAFDVLLPGGARQHYGPPGAPAFTLVVHDPARLLGTLPRGHMALLEAYFDGALDIEGDFSAVFRAAASSGVHDRPRLANWLENQWHELRHSNRDRRNARANARAHYDLPVAFYRLWLDDPLMLYTCAYWPEGTATLEQAQLNKIEHVCRKVRLAPGEHFVDVGCGFGGFLIEACRRHGAIGTGVNASAEQVAWARQQAQRFGLADRITLRETDCRDVDRAYDKVVSIGVLEHAGRDQLGEVIRAHADYLKPGGIGLLHFIGHVSPRPTELFIRKYVFPGGWIPALSDVLVEMERHGLEVLDVENLRRHYALTLDVWAERFERRWDEIRAIDPQRFDERFRRIWRTYLVGCAEMFRSPQGYTHLFQIVFSKGNVTFDSYPMSRAHVYA